MLFAATCVIIGQTAIYIPFHCGVIFFTVISIIILIWFHNPQTFTNTWQKIKSPTDRRIKGWNLFQIAAEFVLAFILVTACAAYFMPPFEITYPENNAETSLIIDLQGHGAVPGAVLSAYVIDPLNKEWKQRLDAVASPDGTWVIHGIQIGEKRISKSGEKYHVFVRMATREGIEYDSKPITVIRI
ncbi:hypothetical protein [Methanofollis fontis]|nr:hypothetical protein [Methanofollis fontis]